MNASVPVVAALLACAQAGAAPQLTDTEQRWLAAGQPVLAFARQSGLPVDIIVQPTVRPDISPLSMAFIDGRCKLVLTMRGNPMVEQHLAGVDPALQDTVIEAMTAHELGHCWRHRQGAWRALPVGFARTVADGGASATQARADEQRLEEGFADLVGLAWTRSRHPAAYAQVHRWLARERGDAASPGAAHDTAVWVGVARDPGAFSGTGTLFEQAMVVWEAGLVAGE